MVEQLTRRQCGWCGRLTTDFYDRKYNKYFCDSICRDEYAEHVKYNGF